MLACKWADNGVDVVFVLLKHIWELSEDKIWAWSPVELFSWEFVVAFVVETNSNEVIFYSSYYIFSIIQINRLCRENHT